MWLYLRVGRAILATTLFVTIWPVVPVQAYSPGFDPCPRSCTGKSPDNWDVYSSFQKLQRCHHPMIFDMALHTPVDDKQKHIKIRACSSSQNNPDSQGEAIGSVTQERPVPVTNLARGGNSLPLRREGQEYACTVADPITTELEIAATVASGSLQAINTSIAITILKDLDTYLHDEASCGYQVFFGYWQETVVGAYVGEALRTLSLASVINYQSPFIPNGESMNYSKVAAQFCSDDGYADRNLGIMIDASPGSIATVQRQLRDWNIGKCSHSNTIASVTKTIDVWEVPISSSVVNSTGTGHFNPRREPRIGAPKDGILLTRDDCRVIQVASGNGCDDLAKRCGISPQKFEEYNPIPDLCSTLQPKQSVCCSPGDLPDIRPQPNPDGSCVVHKVKSGDYCEKIAGANGLTVDDLESFNTGEAGTWGWSGCENLLTGLEICLSTGTPPMPAPVANAVCGPMKPGSLPPAPVQALSDLNPCLLNACCSIWGQCGIDEEFCIEGRGPTGNPGTAPEGVEGCISNCGMDIVNNIDAPPKYGRVGYYESWNMGRDCLYLTSNHADVDSKYTLLHWAFMGINPNDFTVVIEDEGGQWAGFTRLRGVRRVISFGGWSFSNEPETYDILRKGVNPENRETFATNIVNFVNEHGIDGVDFDWEYPGATDIPGTPPGSTDDPLNYLEFLKLMREKLPAGDKSISIAAPASYWYLRNLPIKEISDVIDYIVYMTYDLHGQWDTGNKWSSSGCPTGNCLRSHVNITETEKSLSMITKAGVPAWKVYVGESSYGRSFHMSEKDCYGPLCTFTGGWLRSDAKPGRCTKEAGLLANAEIYNIIETYTNVRSWYDPVSDSDLMVYSDLEWVGYMSDGTKEARRSHWQGFNFGGTIDWAVDLQAFTEDVPPGDDFDDTWLDLPPLPSCDATYTALEDVERDLPTMPVNCRAVYTLQALQTILSNSLLAYDELVDGGYDHSFDIYAKAVVASGRTAVEDFVYGNGGTYFTCDVTEEIDRCKHCHCTEASDSPVCRYCEDDYDCGWNGICNPDPEEPVSDHHFKYGNLSTKCPPDYSERGQWPPAPGIRYWSQAVYWELKPEMTDAFWADLYDEVGILKEDIVMENAHRFPCGGISDEDCRNRDWDYNFPIPHGYETEDVLNPRDLIMEGRDKLKELGPSIATLLSDVAGDQFPGDLDSVVDALSLPIVMIENSVMSMHKIKEWADQVEAEKRKNIILAFLTAIFMVLPVVGEVISTVSSLANVGRIIALLGEMGSIGLDIESLVEADGNDPLTIFGLVLAPLDVLDMVKMNKASNIRRLMDPADIGKLGDVPKGRMDQIDRIKAGGTCQVPT